MIRSNIQDGCFFEEKNLKAALEDVAFIQSLSKEDIEELMRVKRIIMSDSMALRFFVASINNEVDSLDFKKEERAIEEKKRRFVNLHPSLYFLNVKEEIDSIFNNKNVFIKYEPRKGREKINCVNIIKNRTYLVFIYNRIVNSTQSYVVFSGFPLKAIDEWKEFEHFKKYVPETIYDFTIQKTWSSESKKYNIDPFACYSLVFPD